MGSVYEEREVEEYWRQALADCDYAPFPALPRSVQQAVPDGVIEHRFPRPREQLLGITTSTLIRAAWALVAGRMTDSDDVVFGVTVSDWSAPVAGLDEMTAPTIATVPVRVKFARDQTVSEYLETVQRQATEMIPFEQAGLERIAKIFPESWQACRFQTLLDIQMQDNCSARDLLETCHDSSQRQWFHPYPLMLELQLGADIKVTARFDARAIELWTVQKLIERLECVMGQLDGTAPEQMLTGIETATQWDIKEIWEWNSTVPAPVERCVQEMIHEQARALPSAPAVCAWDGELTYGKLDQLATRLAARLLGLGVGRDTLVPLCFEKSMWATVAMLGVLKAGGAFVFLDPSLPERRLQAIVQQVDASLALSSLSNQSLSSRLTQEVLIINSHFFEDQDDPASQRVNCSSPTSVIYVTFTSGSTGKPKGVMITHGNITSALYHQVDILGFTTKSRVFDFASYSFDISVNYALMTLATGGCLCVPSDQDRRNNVPGSIALLRANALVLTPSVAQFLSPEVMSGLQSMTFVGEALCVADVKRWWGKVRVLNRYGVSECAAASTINCSASSPEEAIHIGKSLGLVTWVVDPENHDFLFPPGCIGELLLEGPLVSRGYLNDPEKTATAFIEDPAWLLRGARGSPGRHGRLYKTGDLVRYNEDGSLTFIGRKDTQVKIRGQRVELGEVEHHMRRSLVDAADASVVAEVITPEGSSNPMLVAFVGLAQAADGIDEGVKAAIRKVTAGAEEKLAEVLPAYMIPSAYIPVNKMPMTATGKTDRRRLREIGGSLTLEQLAELNEPRAELRLPTTAAESQLRQLWAAVLGVEVDSIGVDDSFLRIGGDSVGAMRLVGAAREQGLSLTVADVFKQPRLSEQALLVNADGGGVGEGPSPFSLLNNGLDKDAGRSCAATLLGVGAAQIEDIFPCTPLQEGLLAMTAKRKGDYINRSVLELQDGVDVDRFRVAWEDVRATMPILRTRIIDLPGQGLVQVVANEQIEWPEGNDLAVFVDNDKQRQIGLGTTLSRHGLVSDRDREKTYFVWTMHHALYDGWSMPLMLDEVEKAYRRESREALVPFQAFVKHIASVDKGSARAYWQAQLAGSEATSFPALPTPTYQPVADSTLRHHIAELEWPRNDITASTAVRVAWSILAARYTGSSEVVFGATVTGRQAAVPGIERMAGPTIATVPVRVVLDWEQTVEQLQQQVQAQAVQMTAFEQLGLPAIRSINQDIMQGSQFQTLIVVQPAVRRDERRGDEGVFQPMASEADDTNGLYAFTTYAVMIVCQLEARGIQLEINFDSKVVEYEQVRRIAQQLECVLRQVCEEEHVSAKLRDIETVSQQDLRDIWTWNATVPEVVDACVHDLIAERTAKQPDAPAICAWDGELTYRELDKLSTRLAHQLVGLGVGPNVIVPLCFEKSMWTPVAMLAVMKAGGASVAMDSSQPEERLRSIVQQVEPIVVVSSAANEALAGLLTTADVVVVDAQHLSRLEGNGKSRTGLPMVKSSDTLYIVFTSGSTGTPKGAIITHRNFSSAIHHQQSALGFNNTSRVFDFVSYAFDVTWSNLLHTLSAGGCLCVPSEIDRYSNTEQSMVSLGVNFADLTPTVGRLLNGSHIPALSTLILGGERVTAADVARWKHQVTLLHTYGPAECTVTSTFETIDRNKQGDPSIGRGIGCNTWVVDSRGHDRLLPVGSVGELVLEGTLVGAGYLSDPEKTAAAFVQDPPWLLQGHHGVAGRRGRLYRTGDLVRYNTDGTLAFIGRKDTQVKIRGQRVELGEIESHMARHPSTLQSASLLPKCGPCANRLVGIFSLKGVQRNDDGRSTIQLTPNRNAAQVQRHVEALQALLGDALPSYMVPSVWIALRDIPLSASGKLDKKQLQAWLSGMDPETYTGICHTDRGSSPREPATDAERLLRDACSLVLSVPAANIDLQRSFIANGGDSISAMRLSSHCRDVSIVFSVAALLKSKSLAGVAQASAATTNSKVSRREGFDKPFGLSPIQRWFFAQSSAEQVSNKSHYFNQGFYVNIRRRVSPGEISSAISEIVQQHSMLRARFQRIAGDWTQRVLKPVDGLHHFGSSQLESLSEVESRTIQRHQELHIERGPVFAADMYTLPAGDQYLVLIAHHLVVDLVSWRIILDDLQTLLTGGTLEAGLPFQVWSQLQTEKAKTSELDPENVLPTEETDNDLEFWNFDQATPNAFGDHDGHSVVVDRRITSLLLKNANGAFNTEPVDLILSAIWDAFLRVFPGREGLTIFNESHGREPWSAEIDLTRTVGWFTTISPIHVSRSIGNSPANIVRLVKDTRRRLPANGWAYFTSRYLNDVGIRAFKAHDSTMEVAFNYHGQFQQLEHDNSLFANVSLDGVSDVGPALPSSALVDINAWIASGLTHFSFSWNRHIAHQGRVREWIEEVGPSLRAICDELASSKTSTTLCDYEFLSLDYGRLEELQSRTIPRMESANGAAVEDIYPCSPMVDGILLSQIREPGSYETSQTYKIGSRGIRAISLDGLAEAWQGVIARHPSLRTVFTEGMDATAAFNQVVLKSCDGEVVVLRSQSEASALAMLKQLPPVDYRQLKPPHRLALCQISDGNHVICRLEMSHAITDGGSTAIILDDWAKAYAGTLSLTGLLDTSRDFARALKSSSTADKMAFWKKKLAGVETCHFPHLSDAPRLGVEVSTASIDIGGETFTRIQQFCEEQSVTPASLFQSAWALTLAAYTGMDSVCFGYLASGRDISIRGIGESVGAYANMLICRADISREWTGQRLVRHLHDQVVEDLGFQHCSLAGIQHELNIPPGQGLFNTIVSFQTGDDDRAGAGSRDLIFVSIGGEDPSEYDIAISIGFGTLLASCSLAFRLSCLSDERAHRVVSFLEAMITALIGRHAHGPDVPLGAEGEEKKLRDIGAVSQQDLRDIWTWNATVPEAVDACVHDLIAERTAQQPDAPAICAWDGELTYRKLDELSTRLAYQLVGLGVGPNVIVPLCFEKSMWTAVAMLAVMKAGGASVAMDSSQPEERLRSIAQQVEPIVVVSSAANEALAGRLAVATVLVVDAQHLGRLERNGKSRTGLPMVKSSDTLYIVFTSGSTGTPKGAMITHRNFSSAIHHQQAALGFNNTSRVFDFVSYAFDATWSNLLHTLSGGGCLCVPSESDRHSNTEQSMVSLGVNVAEVTPTVGRLLNGSHIPALSTLILGGERVTATDVARWKQQVTLLNTYGPAECTVNSTIEAINQNKQGDPSIGRGIGCNTWVVNQHMEICEIGCIGELVLEGPLVGQGYISDPVKTDAAFVEDPPWLLRGGPGFAGRRGRLYRTGDLVRYNADGTLVFIGRKDTQVKIRGQRVELGEVENQVRRSLVDAVDASVVAEVITPAGSSNPMLVAFLDLGEAADGSDDVAKAAMRKVTAGTEEKLAELLPAYMIPSAYIPIDKVPMTATGKTDRRRLREIGGSFTLEQLAELNASRGERRQPRTAAEGQLQQLWAAVLGIEAGSIGVDDSFLRIGGDSVGAMRLVGAARDQGLTLTVANVFKQPRLSEQALLVNVDGGGVEEAPPPFSLLKAGLDKSAGCTRAAALCGVDAAQIEDIFPCTPLQEGLLAMTAKRRGDYINRSVLELQDGVDADRFRAAWEDVRATMPILRTRIIDLPGQGLVQVIVNEQMEWLVNGDLEAYLSHEEQQHMGMGTALTRFGLVRDGQDGKRYFVWTLHHALYDGWSMPLMLDEVEKAYRGERREPLAPFQAFVKHITSTDENSARVYWQAQLAGSEATSFPALPTPTYQPVADSTLRHHIAELEWPRNDITASTVVRVAWSILAARYTGSSEVVFGATVTGRQAAVPGIERMSGPTIATVPVRVVLDWEQRVEQLQQQVQAQAVEMTAFEQLGLPAIRSISQDTEQGSQFQTLLVVQPTLRQDERRGDKGLFQLTASDADDTNGLNAFTTYAVMMVCELQARGMQLEISFDSEVVESKQVRRMAQQLECVLRQVCVEEQGSAKLRDIETVSQQDLRDIWTWNATVPEVVDACVHDLIAERTAQQPDAPAVCAWDGELTYRELDKLSTRLAHQLVGLGVRPNVIVPLCFEKSMWTAVAMLAVMKAGGASVAMDSSQPEERLRSIVQQVEPIVVVSSAANEALAGRLSMATVLVVDAQHLAQTKGGDRGRATLPTVQPSDTLYIVFTSGSTGTPKGAIITHRNFSSAIRHQQAALGFNTTSRVFDFVSYAFDVTWSNLLHTLSVGGCLCVPSESDRYGNPEQSMVSLGVNYAHLTPTVGRLLNGSHIPLLSTLRLGGERMMGADVARWKQQGTLLNTYGPAECTVTSTLESINQNKYGDPSIGRGSGCNTWVVDSGGHNQLVPVGSVGELVLEGPLVGGGYLLDPEKTAAAFVQDPPWLLKGEQGVGGRQGQLYRTGDLVRYSADGTLVFIGRKDAQVKIHGQRVELGEVEHHVQCSLVDAADASVVAEVITPEGSSNAILVAFVGLGEAVDGGDDKAKAVMRRITAGAEKKLAEVLPAYMIPSAYIPINKVPMTATGKTDRRRLREIGGLLTLEQLAELNPCRGEQQQPSTAAEGQLQRLWAAVLGIAASSIGVDDSFFRIGGDSIAAMRLVGAAREQGLSLTVADVFKQPRLSEQALLVKISRTPYYDPRPFSLVSTEHELNHYLRLEISPYLDHPGETVLEVLPVTYFQAQCITSALTKPLGRCYHFFIDLSHSTDIVRLFDSCIKLWDSLDILRTVFIQGRHGYLQVVGKKVRPIIDVYETKGDLTKFSQTIYDEDLSSPLKLGKPFTRFLITHASDGQKRLTIRLSHAQYDGISLGQILSCLAACYDGREPPAIPKFAGYIKHDMIHRESARDYWRLFLHGSRITKIRPTAVTTRVHNKASLSGKEIKLKRTCPVPQCQNGLTPATLFTALIACALGRSTKSSDVVFGLLVSGRSMLPSGLQGAIGPCLNYIPIRVRFADDVTLDFALKYVEEQRLRGLQFETSQFTDIVRHCTDWPGPPKDFGVVVQYQNIEENPTADISGENSRLNVHEREEDMDTPVVSISATPVQGSWNLEVIASVKFQEREQLKAGAYRIQGTSIEAEVRRLTAAIGSAKTKRRNIISQEFRDDYFRRRPTEDIERHNNGQHEEEYVEPVVEHQIPQRRQLVDLICPRVRDITSQNAVKRRIQVAELMLAICKCREVPSRYRLRVGIPPPSIFKEESPELGPLDPIFPIKLSKKQCPFCIGDESKSYEQRMGEFSRPATMMNHVENIHLKGRDPKAKIECFHPTCKSQGLVLEKLEYFKSHVELVHKITLRE
ncbi:hypothetical protein V500_01452 [Pseudogymnoascus sp. VKM F-4518 (FW-2643)]|nr:hypothetical protein V500_01452 [Pseudogymnoascus sp. VKM F-4518 (FW-2643)]